MPASKIIQTKQTVAAAIVTFKRQELLTSLLNSILEMQITPDYLVVVDNENSEETKKIVSRFSRQLKKLDKDIAVTYKNMETNTGGAGGFAMGTEMAYKTGADWIWLMDDDVLLYPDALVQMIPHLESGVQKDHRVIQPRRRNYDDTSFYWQYHFLVKLGIPNPVAPSAFSPNETYKNMNTACFEGGFFHRSIVYEIGTPDKRFFIYWDDTLYGYLASKLTNPILVENFIMKRSRQIDNMKIGTIRKLNGTSNMVRYYIMRNRAYMARYFMLYGEYNRFLYGLGTLATFAKELIRLIIDRQFKEGFKAIFRGWKDSRKIYKDKDWKPVGPLLD